MVITYSYHYVVYISLQQTKNQHQSPIKRFLKINMHDISAEHMSSEKDSIQEFIV